MIGLTAASWLGLVAFGLSAGVGISAVGPGGVLATVGLVALTSLTPAQVAGTAIVTHVATGAVGTAAYARSGHLDSPETRRMAIVLSLAALVGTPIGIIVTGVVPARTFGFLLGGLVAAVAAVMLRRREPAAGASIGRSMLMAAACGLAVSVASGVFGLGGPMLAVPLLMAAGVPGLSALAAAQVQSITIATVGTCGYLIQGSVCWPLAIAVGLPELAGVLIGWVIARRLHPQVLRKALIASLMLLVPYLILRS